jgi:hypothetical protein
MRSTMLKLGRLINEGESLDNLELALIYNKMPNEFRDITINPYLVRITATMNTEFCEA